MWEEMWAKVLNFVDGFVEQADEMPTLASAKEKGFTAPVPEPTETPAPTPTPNPFEELGYVRNAQGSWVLPEEQVAPTAMPTPSPTPVPGSQWDFLENTVFPRTDAANIPRPIAAGQWAGEGRGTHKYAKDPYNNPYNIGAYDSNPDMAVQYKAVEDGIDAYVRLLSSDPNYDYKDILQEYQDPAEMIRRIGPIYTGDPTTWAERSDSGYNSYADFIMNTPEWRRYYQP